jgi:NADPH2:quinone reductase
MGSYAEFALVPAWKLVKIPDKLDFKTAAALPLQGMTAHYLVYSTFVLQKDQTALIHAGAGGVWSALDSDGSPDWRHRLLDRG